MGIGIVVILCGICYAFASSEVTELYINNGLESASASKRVGGGLLLTYILGSIAIVVSILSGLIKSIR